MSMSHDSRHVAGPTRMAVPVLKATAVAVGLALSGAAGAISLQFDNGVSGSFDTTISAGVSVRTEKPDPTLIGIANGGTSRSVNEDDGDRGYKRGDTFSELLKVTHDLELKQGTWGVFIRGLYFMDFKNRNNQNLGPIGRDRLGSDVEARIGGLHDAGDRRGLGGRQLDTIELAIQPSGGCGACDDDPATHHRAPVEVELRGRDLARRDLVGCAHRVRLDRAYARARCRLHE